MIRVDNSCLVFGNILLINNSDISVEKILNVCQQKFEKRIEIKHYAFDKNNYIYYQKSVREGINLKLWILNS